MHICNPFPNFLLISKTQYRLYVLKLYVQSTGSFGKSLLKYDQVSHNPAIDKHLIQLPDTLTDTNLSQKMSVLYAVSFYTNRYRLACTRDKYSIPQEISTRFCCVLLCCGYVIVHNEFHIHQGCFAGTGAIVRLPQCQWSKPDGYGKISQCITTTKHSKAKTVCIFLGIYCSCNKWLLLDAIKHPCPLMKL